MTEIAILAGLVLLTSLLAYLFRGPVVEPPLAPHRWYSFRCELSGQDGPQPIVTSGVVLAVSDEAAWDWVASSMHLPGEWHCELWRGRPQYRRLIVDVVDDEIRVGRRPDLLTSRN